MVASDKIELDLAVKLSRERYYISDCRCTLFKL